MHPMASTLFLKAAEHAETTPKDRLRVQPMLIPIPGRVGFVFGLVAIEKQKPTDATPLPTIEEHLERFAETFGTDTNPQRQFEIFLNSLNTELAGQVRGGAWQTPIGQFHAIVGVACEESLFLSGTGEILALFLHRKPSSQRYQVFNLSRSIHTEQALPTWEKAFAVVLDGDIHAGDVLCLSNQDLLRTIDQEEINSLLAALPPKSAVAKIRQYFPASTNLSLIIIKGDSNETSAGSAVQSTPLAHTSVEKFEQNLEETERLLGETESPLSTLVKKHKKKNTPTRSEDNFKSNKPPGKLKVVGGAIVSGIGQSVVSSGRLLTSMVKKNPDNDSPSLKARLNVKKPRAWIKHLPKGSKILLIIAIICVIGFGVGIGLFFQKRQTNSIIKEYTSQVSSVEDLITQVEGALIYKDRTKAKKLIEDSLAQLNQLPTATPEQIATKESLLTRLNKQKDSLRNLVRIDSPVILGNLPVESTGALLVKNGPSLFVLDSNAAVFEAGTEASSLKKREVNTGGVGSPLSVAGDSKRLVFLDDRPGISQFDIENDQSKVLEIDIKPYNSKAITLYNGRLYMVGSVDGNPQILRSNASGSGFGTPSNWIKTKTSDLSNAVDLTIDTRIYVLTSDGGIHAFLEGNELGWKTVTVDPPIKTAKQLITETDSSYLYVLDIETKRVVVFNKQDGTFVSQYELITGDNLKSFAIDEKTKTLFLLTDKALFSTSLTHL